MDTEDFLYGIFYIVMVVIGALITYSIVEPLFRSEERQAEIIATQEAAEAQRNAQWESQLRDRAIEVVGDLYYVQDSRTGFCFAVRSVYRLGHLAQVDCDAVPANMLLTTE